MDDKEPPLRRLVLKPREAAPVAPPPPPPDNTGEDAPAEIKWDGIPVARPETPEPHGGASVFKAKEIVPTDPRPFAGDESVISIHAMLDQNRRAAGESTPELIAMPRRRRSRRHRDFALVLAGAAVSFVVLAIVFIRNLPFLGLATFGIVFTTAILGWIIYGVMDKY
jgi:hypothetical protein